MPRAYDTWTVLSHGPIDRLTDNLWRVEGSLPDMPLKRTMTIARRADGRLVIHNPIALDDPAMRDLESWGRPADLLVPNGWHRLDAPVYKQRYPAVRVLCPAGGRARVAQVVAVDGTYADFEVDDHITLAHLDGVRQAEGVMTVRSPGGVTVVLNDIVMNLVDHYPGLFGFVYRLMGSTGGPKITPVIRLLMVKDRRALRAHLERLAATPDLRRVIVSHGRMMTDAPGETLRHVAGRL